MEWEVVGADRQSGQDKTLVIEAVDEAQAVRRANRKGLIVSGARPLDPNDSVVGVASQSRNKQPNQGPSQLASVNPLHRPRSLTLTVIRFATATKARVFACAAMLLFGALVGYLCIEFMVKKGSGAAIGAENAAAAERLKALVAKAAEDRNAARAAMVRSEESGRHEAIQREQDTEQMELQAQGSRASLAAAEFSPILLEPSKLFSLSKRLRSLGAKLVIRGPKYPELASLRRKGDWLGLINAVSGGTFNRYPSVNEIQSAAGQLWQCDFTLVLELPSARAVEDVNGTEGVRLFSITFPPPRGGAPPLLIDYSGGWQLHPDGIGYLRRWSPHEGRGVIVLTSPDVEMGEMFALNRQLTAKESELDARVRLGEIDEATRSSELKAYEAQLATDAANWAERL